MFFKLMVGLSIFLSLMVGLIPSPFMLCLVVLVLSGSSCALVSLFCSQWLSYALVIVFLGGMMVLFTYASSMSVSDKFIKKSSHGGVLAFFVGGGLLSVPSAFKVCMSSLYSGLSIVVLLVTTLYLLLSLFSVVKMVEVSSGALIS